MSSDSGIKLFLIPLIIISYVVAQSAFFLESIFSYFQGLSIPVSHVSSQIEIFIIKFVLSLIALSFYHYFKGSKMRKMIDFRSSYGASFALLGAGLIFIYSVVNGSISLIILPPFIFFFIAIIYKESDFWSVSFRDVNFGYSLLLVYVLAPVFILFTLKIFEMTMFPALEDFFIVNVDSNFGLFSGRSFRGFTESRTSYSMLCGFLIIYTILFKRMNFSAVFLVFVLSFALLISASRSSLVALALIAMFFMRSRLFLYVSLVVGPVSVLLLSLITARVEVFGDPGQRLQILYSTIEYLWSNSNVFFFGYEGFFSDLSEIGIEGLRPHSSILNSILNHGVLVTACWLIFISGCLSSIDVKGRSVLAYFLVIGIFHNEFDAYFFGVEQLLAFFMAARLGVNYDNSDTRSI